MPATAGVDAFIRVMVCPATGSGGNVWALLFRQFTSIRARFPLSMVDTCSAPERLPDGFVSY